MSQYISLVGNRYGKLTVVNRAEDHISSSGRRRTQFVCKCDCGRETVVTRDNLVRGYAKSCGCLAQEKASQQFTTHGETNTRLYGVWSTMKARCNNPHVAAYRRYGGRGIAVCDAWNKSYEAFRDWALANGYDPNAPRGETTIDRIDGNGDYCPENCRWVTAKVQANNLSTNRRLTNSQGEEHTLSEWGDLSGIPANVIQQRISRYGYTLDEAVTIPLHDRRRSKR